MKRSTSLNENAHSDVMGVTEVILNASNETVKRKLPAASGTKIESIPRSDKLFGCVAMEGSLIPNARESGVDNGPCLTVGRERNDQNSLTRGNDLPPASSLSFLQPRARSIALCESRLRECLPSFSDCSSQSVLSTANTNCGHGRSLLTDGSMNPQRRAHATSDVISSNDAGRDKDTLLCESPSTPMTHEDGIAIKTPDSTTYSERQNISIPSPTTDFNNHIQNLSLQSPVQRLPSSASGSPYTPSFKSSFSPHDNRATANAVIGLPKLHASSLNPSPRHVSVTVLSNIDFNQVPIQPSPRKARSMILTSPAGTPRRHDNATILSPRQMLNLTPKRKALVSPHSNKKSHPSPRTPLPKLTLSPRISPQIQSLLFQSPGADYVPMYSHKEDAEVYRTKAGKSLDSTMDVLQQPNLAFPLADIQCGNKKKRSLLPSNHYEGSTGESTRPTPSPFHDVVLAFSGPLTPEEKMEAEFSRDPLTDFVFANEQSHASNFYADDAKKKPLAKAAGVGSEMDVVSKLSSYKDVVVSKGELLQHGRSQLPHAAYKGPKIPVATDSWLHLKPDKKLSGRMRRHDSLTFSDDGSTSSLSSVDDEANEKPRRRRRRRSSIHRHHKHGSKIGAPVPTVSLQRNSGANLGIEAGAPSVFCSDRFSSVVPDQSVKPDQSDKSDRFVSSSRTGKALKALLEHDVSEDEVPTSDFEDDGYKHDAFFLDTPCLLAKHQQGGAMPSHETLILPMNEPKQDCVYTGGSWEQNNCCLKDTNNTNGSVTLPLTSLQSVDSHSGSCIYARRSRHEHQRLSSDISESPLLGDDGNSFDRHLSTATLFGMDIIHENAAIEVSLPAEMPMHTPKDRKKNNVPSDGHTFFHHRVTSENSLSSLDFVVEDTTLCSDGVSSRDLITPPAVRQVLRSPPPIHQTNLAYLLDQGS